MGFGFIFSGPVKSKIKERLKKDCPGEFTNDELELAAKRFEEAGDSKDLDALKNDVTQKGKAIEIFKRIKPQNEHEARIVSKINKLYSVA